MSNEWVEDECKKDVQECDATMIKDAQQLITIKTKSSHN
jgi:hypothetical protein